MSNLLIREHKCIFHTGRHLDSCICFIKGLHSASYLHSVTDSVQKRRLWSLRSPPWNRDTVTWRHCLSPSELLCLGFLHFCMTYMTWLLLLGWIVWKCNFNTLNWSWKISMDIDIWILIWKYHCKCIIIKIVKICDTKTISSENELNSHWVSKIPKCEVGLWGMAHKLLKRQLDIYVHKRKAWIFQLHSFDEEVERPKCFIQP